jgi:hypothetical protein
MRNYTSEEKFDISKFMNFENDVYDVLNSPFLAQISQLPTVEYYNVDFGFKEIDLISSEKYGTPFFAYLIQFYNNDFRETFPEGTILNLFSLEDLNEIYYNLSTLSNLKES